MTARPAAAEHSSNFPALGPNASDLGLQAGEKGECARLDSKTAVRGIRARVSILVTSLSKNSGK